MSAVSNDWGLGLVILGAGRGSAELLDMLDAVHVPSIVILDDRFAGGGGDLLGVPVVGGLDQVGAYVARGYRVLSGIAGSTAVDAGGTRRLGTRIDLPARLGLPRSAWASFVHPRATVSTRASVGLGVIAYPGAQVHVGATVADHVLLYPQSVVHHDVVVDEGAILCAGVLLAGHVHVGAGCYVGIGSAVRERVTIGERSLIGMGAVVVGDVVAGSLVRGVPAR